MRKISGTVLTAVQFVELMTGDYYSNCYTPADIYGCLRDSNINVDSVKYFPLEDTQKAVQYSIDANQSLVLVCCSFVDDNGNINERHYWFSITE